MQEYSIYLSSENYDNYSNEYGYWAGKCYVVQYNYYPLCDSTINERTKRYKSKIRAEKMAEKIYEKCGTVSKWIIIEIGNESK